MNVFLSVIATLCLNLVGFLLLGVVVKVCRGAGGRSCSTCGVVTDASDGQWSVLTCPRDLWGDTVRVEKNHRTDPLIICEVTVYTPLPVVAGTWLSDGSRTTSVV